MGKVEKKIRMELRSAQASFDRAIASLQGAARSVDDGLIAMQSVRATDALAQGFISAVAHVSASPLLTEHPQVRDAIVAALENEMEIRCGGRTR